MGFFQDIFGKARDVFISPKKFFNSIKKERGKKIAFLYFAILSLISVIGSFIAMNFNLPILASQSFFSAYIGIGGIFIDYIFSLISIFITVFFAHVILFKGFLKGKGDYATSFRLIVYSYTPILFLGWIKYADIIALIYYLYLLYQGMQILHGISERGAKIWAIILAIIFVGASLLIAIVSIFNINQFTNNTTTATSTTLTSTTNCGGYRQICCTSGSVCDAGFSCQAGLCQPCGGVGNGCCSGHTCNFELSCDTTQGINPPDGVCVSIGCDPVICNNDCKSSFGYNGSCRNSICYCSCVASICDTGCKNDNYQSGGYCLNDSPCLSQNGGACSSNCQCIGSPSPTSISISTTTTQTS